MTANYSLQLSEEIAETMRKNLTGPFISYYPKDKVLNHEKQSVGRDRIYNDETTLLTMILTAVQEDKSIQNAVNIYSVLHKENISKLENQVKIIQKQEQEKDQQQPKTRGRPKKYKVKIAKSKLNEISTNTGSYTTARQRLEIDLINKVYEDSADFEGIEVNTQWKGMDVHITDGTYIQMQDTKDLRKEYGIRSKSPKYKAAYPQGLLQVIIEQGSGAITHFELGSRHVSELELVSNMLPKLKKKSLLLADDLYNSSAIFGLIYLYGLDIIVPGKRTRKYTIKKKISEGDEIVEINVDQKAKWLLNKEKLPDKVLMRKISFENPREPGKEYIIYTSLLNKKINKTDIVLKYFTRWDIEISIREIKTLMDINVVRSKSPEMVIKELTTSLIAYNLVRKIIASATENSGFSPKADIIQKCFAPNKKILMDKKGRIYSRWSSGRFGGSEKAN